MLHIRAAASRAAQASTCEVQALLRAMHAHAAGVVPCAIDFGGLVDAIWVDSGALLGFYNITVRNTGPRSITRLDNRARYKAMYWAPWPSIVLSPGAQVCTMMRLMAA